MSTREGAVGFSQMVADTIGRVNVVRQAFGFDPVYELPDAKPGDDQDCLYFRALADVGCTGVGASGMTFDSERKAEAVARLWNTGREGYEVTSPRDITRTIGEFDRRNTPHYNV